MTLTKRELLEAMVTGTELTEEMKEFAQRELEKMDLANKNRREKAQEKLKENEPLVKALMEVMGDEFKTAAMLLAEAELDITPQKVAFLMRQFVDEGVVEKEKIKVDKSTKVGYRLV